MPRRGRLAATPAVFRTLPSGCRPDGCLASAARREQVPVAGPPPSVAVRRGALAAVLARTRTASPITAQQPVSRSSYNPLGQFLPERGSFRYGINHRDYRNTRVRQILIDVDQCHRALHPQNLVPFNSAGAPWVLRSDVFEKSRYLSQSDTFRNHGELERTSGQTPTSEATVMNKTLLYMAPIALVGLLGTDTPAKAAFWSA